MNKKILYFILFSVLNVILCTKVIAQEQNESEAFRLVVFGDSLSAGYHLSEGKGYIPQLQKTLNEDGLDNVKVINAAISGNTTSDGLNRINDVLAKQPHAVILELGANDLLQKQNLQETAQNLDKIISTFLDRDIPVMLIGIKIPLTTNINDREMLSKIYKDLAKKYNLVFYPHFLQDVLKETLGMYNFDYMQDDGVHPNEEGVKIMVQKTYPIVKNFLMNI